MMRLLLLCVLFAVRSLSSQSIQALPEKEGELFIGYGIGHTGGLAFTAGLAITPGWGRIGTRITSLNPYSKVKAMSTYDLLVGKQFDFNHYSVSLSTGIGTIESEEFNLGIPGFAFGIPIDMQVVIPTNRKSKFNFILGLNIFGNFNNYSPIIGVTLLGIMVG